MLQTKTGLNETVLDAHMGHAPRSSIGLFDCLCAGLGLEVVQIERLPRSIAGQVKQHADYETLQALLHA